MEDGELIGVAQVFSCNVGWHRHSTWRKWTAISWMNSGSPQERWKMAAAACDTGWPGVNDQEQQRHITSVRHGTLLTRSTETHKTPPQAV